MQNLTVSKLKEILELFPDEAEIYPYDNDISALVIKLPNRPNLIQGLVYTYEDKVNLIQNIKGQPYLF